MESTVRGIPLSSHAKYNILYDLICKTCLLITSAFIYLSDSDHFYHVVIACWFSLTHQWCSVYLQLVGSAILYNVHWNSLRMHRNCPINTQLHGHTLTCEVNHDMGTGGWDHDMLSFTTACNHCMIWASHFCSTGGKYWSAKGWYIDWTVIKSPKDGSVCCFKNIIGGDPSCCWKLDWVA